MKKSLLASALTLVAFSVTAAVEVTKENYSTAMFDMGMTVEANNGARQDWHHHRAPIALDKQPAPMMNRDTLYSFVIADAQSDIKVTIPEMDGRYVSVQVMNHNHETAQMFYGAGEHIIKADETTDYIAFYARTQMNASSPEDIAKANGFQDQMSFEYVDSSYQPEIYKDGVWDMDSFKKIHQHYVELAGEKGILHTMSDLERGVIVSQEATNRGVSVATGLLPDAHAQYINTDYHLDASKCYVATHDVPPQADTKLGFYSITIYDEDIYLATDEHSIITNSDITLNDDNTFTVYYGNTETCGDVANLLHVPTNEFTTTMRVYLPDVEAMNHYQVGELTEVN